MVGRWEPIYDGTVEDIGLGEMPIPVVLMVGVVILGAEPILAETIPAEPIPEEPIPAEPIAVEPIILGALGLCCATLDAAVAAL